MDTMQKAAFLQTQAACAIVEAIAILVTRTQVGDGGTAAKDIRALIDKYGIGYNDVIRYLGEP